MAIANFYTVFFDADIETAGNLYTHISNLRKNTLAKDLENTFRL